MINYKICKDAKGQFDMVEARYTMILSEGTWTVDSNLFDHLI